jgi:VIT1/CCC1 family predicted Fe2+/Mn2+ transporter
LVTFIAFLLIGFIPLIAFVSQLIWPYPVETAYLWSSGLTAVAFFGVGAAKSMFVDEKWYVAGLETLLVGGTAAGLAYGIGALLRQVIAV